MTQFFDLNKQLEKKRAQSRIASAKYRRTHKEKNRAYQTVYMKKYDAKHREEKKAYRKAHPIQAINGRKRLKLKSPHYFRDWKRVHPNTEAQKEHIKEWNATCRKYIGKKIPKKIQDARNFAYRHVPLLDCCELCESKKYLRHHHPDYDYPQITVTCCASCHEYIHWGQ